MQNHFFPPEINWGRDCWKDIDERQLVRSAVVIQRGRLFGEVASHVLQIVDTDRVYTVDKEPSSAMVDEARRQFAVSKGLEIYQVIGIGGGSAMDTAKMVAQGNYDCWTIPTVAGSGSEVTHEAVIKQSDGQPKAFLSKDLMPSRVFIDHMMQGLAEDKKKYLSSVDMLSASEEVMGNQYSSPLCRSFALSAREKIVTFTTARDLDLATASVCSGFAFGNSGTTFIHALSYPFGKRGVAHSLAVAVAFECFGARTDSRVIKYVAEGNQRYKIHLPKCPFDRDKIVEEIVADERHLSRCKVRPTKLEIGEAVDRMLRLR